ncbi:hypothetical protein TanjilG_24731 [Lupinus angustifolius]|uniref:PRLI-interacting factor A n=1 Tax=Lupinus angustifolius TaxID=3871 RepID=A0A4P1RLF9_LUPAN|nr:PREDICTED: uncharacterized protein LOC109346489 isoform X1 [Lupinus angustifolius]OIW12798.1 hypothetical protein TanjilG_24731 [Lupinus angustifolius]
MNDQSQMMMNLNNLNQPQMMNQVQKMMNQPPQMMNQQPKPQMKQSQIMMNQNQPQIINRGGYNKFWFQQHQQQPHMDPNMKFKNPMQSNFAKPRRINNWKGKKVTDNRKDTRRIVEKPNQSSSLTVPIPINNNTVVGGGYQPPTLYELQSQNRLKARKFYPKKRFNNRFAPYAPRNTTSFIIRAKKSGGIASLVSPCPVTPAVLPTPILSPSREVLGDMVKEEWGVDGYGSMKGLIRLRSPGHEEEEEEDGGGGGSSESDVEEHVEVERRLDHDLSRFEMIYPNYGGDYNNGLENRVDDQDSHIAQLEEENLTLKERLFLMERELGDLRRRLLFLERQNQVVEDVNEEVVENGSDNESEGGLDFPVRGIENNVEMVQSRLESGENGNFEVNARVENDGVSDAEGVVDVCMEESVQDEVVAKKDEINGNEMKDKFVINEVKESKEEQKDEDAIQLFVPDEIPAKENDTLYKNASGEI